MGLDRMIWLDKQGTLTKAADLNDGAWRINVLGAIYYPCTSFWGMHIEKIEKSQLNGSLIVTDDSSTTKKSESKKIRVISCAGSYLLMLICTEVHHNTIH